MDFLWIMDVLWNFYGISTDYGYPMGISIDYGCSDGYSDGYSMEFLYVIWGHEILVPGI